MNVILEQEFCDYVKRRLDEKGWSLRELARRLEMNPSLLSKYLTQRQSAGTEQMERILSALGVEAHLSFVEVEEKLAASA